MITEAAPAPNHPDEHQLHARDEIEVDGYLFPLRVEVRHIGGQAVIFATDRDYQGNLRSSERFHSNEAEWVEDKAGGHWHLRRPAA